MEKDNSTYDPTQDALRVRLEKQQSTGYDPSQDVIRRRVEGKAQTDVSTSTPPVRKVNVDMNIDKADAGSDLDRKAATAGVDHKIAYFRDQLNKIKLESEEDRQKREKRERARKIIAAVGDGIRAMSNLYFTSQYAPNQKSKTSQAAVVSDQIAQLKAERDKNADQYNNFMLQLGNAESERAKTLRDLAAQQEARKLARDEAKRKDDEAKRKAALFPDQARKIKGDADASEADAKIKAERAKAEPEYQKGRIALQDERVKTEKAKQSASYARGASYGRSNDKSKTFYVDGSPVVFSESEYNNGNIAQVYKLVPDAIKRKYSKGQYGDIGIEEMSAAIGEALNTPAMTIKSGSEDVTISPASEVGGALMRFKKSSRKPNPMGNGKGKKSNPMN